MECHQCRFQNPQDAKFCNECGSKLELVCPQCGKSNPAESKFCNACGAKLQAVDMPLRAQRDARSSYTPKFIAETYLTKPGVVDGERKPVTVMFADVANSTRLFEKLDSEEVHWIMDRCFKLLIGEIHRYEGTINQFMGDGVMALFGAPVAHEDHAQRACRAALAIQQKMVDFGEKIRKDFGVVFQIRIGLNSGPVVVGAIGDDLRMDYTAVGNTVHLACRFENLAKPGTIVLSKRTHRLVKNYFNLQSLGLVEVKGVAEPQEIFELLRASEVTTGAEAFAQKGLTHFVGRLNSMASLMEAYEKVKDGSGQVVGVVGEAGVGKSRLIYEFRNRLLKDKVGYLEGRCVHYGAAIPYLPILDILKSYFEIGEGESEIVTQKRVQQRILELNRNFREILPPIQDLLSLKVRDEAYQALESKQKKEKIFEALRDLIVKGSQDRPLIIAIEDLHWIDKVSESFLDYFVGWLANIKVMLVLLYRPEYTCPWGSRSYFSRVGLVQLSQASSMGLVKSILQGRAVAPEAFAFIFRRSAGNPLFMEELTHALVEDGTIQAKDNQYVLALPGAGLEVPETIQGIIAARIDRLEESVKKIMQLASVIGREFSFRILQAISEMDADIKKQLLNLQGLELIYEKSLFPELEFVFKHALTVEVTYNSLLSKKRKEIHRNIGQAIEKLFAGNLDEYFEVLAYHYSKGDLIDKAGHYLKKSGKKAEHTHSLIEAYDYYKKALTMFEKMPEGPEKMAEMIEVVQLMRVPMTLLGFPEDSLGYLQLGERLAMELGDTRRIASIYALMGTYQSHAGDHAAAIRYTEEGLQKAQKAGDIELIVPLGLTVSTSFSATGQYVRLAAAMPDVIDRIEYLQRESDFFSLTVNPYSYICGAYGAALGHLGRFGEGEGYVGKALDNALKLGHAATLGTARFNSGWLLYTKGAYGEAQQHLEQCIPCFNEAQWHLGVALASCYLGHVNFFLGNPEAGKIQAEQGIQMYHESGIELYLSWCKWVIGSIYFDLGDPESATLHTEEALRLSRKNGEQGVEGLALVSLARIAGKKEPSSVDQAHAYLSSGSAILTRLEMKPWIARGLLFSGELHLLRGAGGNALEDLKRAASMFQQMGMVYWFDRTQQLLTSINF